MSDQGNQLLENKQDDMVKMGLQEGENNFRSVTGSLAQTVYISSNKNEEDNEIESELPLLGSQIDDPITDINGITISCFEFGAIVTGVGIPEPLICRYSFPKIGNPAIISPERTCEIKKYIRAIFDPIEKSLYDNIIQTRPRLFEEIFTNRFFLKPVASKSTLDDHLLIPEVNIEPIILPVTNQKDVIVMISFGTNPTASIKDRTLFNVVFNPDRDTILVAAEHSLFAKMNWDNFGILHVTDIHVNRRIEYAKDDLKKHPECINEFNIRFFNSYNDNFRNFISYANSLFNNGLVDCIVATGDLVDYIFDSTEQTSATPGTPSKDVDRVNGNNFDFFRRLILGLEPGRDGTKNEELLVPIFVTLGNHDYRNFPYLWVGEVSIFGFGNPKLNNYPNTNLDFTEAQGLEGGHKGSVSKETAAQYVQVNPDLPQYDKISERSRIVRLGPHRIVMLDSAHDVGIIGGTWDAISHTLGWDSDDMKRFAQASPNCKGVQDDHITLLKQGLAEAGSTGIVIVGIHAPLIDMSYYPHYFRETERRSTQDENEIKRGFPFFAPFFSINEGYEQNGKKPGWPTTGTPYFKFADIDFTLSNGVSKGLNQKFLEICAGVGATRKADLVLSGHGHHNLEFRFVFDQGNHFFHDYYTENPTRYYFTKLLSKSDFNTFLTQFSHTSDTGKREQIFEQFRFKMKTHMIEVKDGISTPTFVEVDDTQQGGQSFTERRIQVPPNPTTLNKTSDKISWWSTHRPLFIQTVALGPIETLNIVGRNPDRRLSDYSFFHGCRKITVKNNVISSIEVVRMSEINAPRPRLCSLKELCKVRRISFPASIHALAKDVQRINPICDRLKIGQ